MAMGLSAVINIYKLIVAKVYGDGQGSTATMHAYRIVTPVGRALP